MRAAPSAIAAAAAGRCFLCDAPARELAWRENGYEAVACACGLAFATPPPAEALVDPTYDAHSAAFYRLSADGKVDWLRRHRQPGKLLEIGCGDGWFLEAARRRGFDVRGLDAHAHRVAHARQRGLHVEQGLLEQSDIDGRFDVVFHCDLLSHFAEPVAALERMRDLLTATGVLFFEVGLLGAPLRAWYPRIGGLGLPQHRWLYSDEALERLWARAKLRVLAQKRFGLGPAVWLSQSIRRVAGTARLLLRRPATDMSPAETAASANAPIVAERHRPRWRQQLQELHERLENLARYDVGAWTPRLGPATLLVLAEPAERAR